MSGYFRSIACDAQRLRGTEKWVVELTGVWRREKEHGRPLTVDGPRAYHPKYLGHKIRTFVVLGLYIALHRARQVLAAKALDSPRFGPQASSSPPQSQRPQ